MAERRHSKDVQGVRGNTAPHLAGGLPIPRGPPREIPRLEPLFGSAVAKGLVSRTLALTGIEPVPAECNGSPLHRDAGRLRLSLDPSSRGMSLPLATATRTFASWTTTGVSAPASTGGRCRLSLPDTHRPGGAISPLDLKGGAAADDEEGARQGLDGRHQL